MSEGQQSESLADRIKESPRTVSALVIILIVAAAIYAFSGEPQQPTAESNLAGGVQPASDEELLAEEESEELGENAESPEATGMVAGDDNAAETTPSGQPEEQEMQELPEPRRSQEGFIEVAQAGEGYTHLARRAAQQWMSENTAGYEITPEHKVFIEDYIQNRIGDTWMSLGQEHLITFDLIREAVDAAGQLNEVQLQNLSQYT